MKKVAIVGSREWLHEYPVRAAIAARINQWSDRSQVSFISGGAPGVDTWAQEAAENRHFRVKVIRPQWTREDGSYNRRAGFERNEEIIQAADLVIVFWNGESKGSKNDIDLALRYHKDLEVHFP